jgi:heterodisulfide reductase subunit A
MARLIKTRRPQTEIACFYIDLQTFGQTFQRFYDTARKDIRMIRTLPGDVLPAPNNCLKAVYYDVGAAESREEPFDMLVLSIGITPAADGRELAAALGLPTSPSGFVRPAANGGAAAAAGVFAAGAVCGPMSIAESVAAGERAAQATAAFLRDERSRPSA